MNLYKEWYTKEFDNIEISTPHRSLEDEYSFYQAIKIGDINYVQKNCEAKVFSNPNGMGILSANPLTNIKYHFVITVALVSRQCIQGGMELEQSYHLSDFYIQKMDQCTSISEVADLHKHMVLDYTNKMLVLQKKHCCSKPISLCLDYIYSHIHDKITISQLAEYTNLSPSHLCKLFKKELGLSISDYIRSKKIDTAKNLLNYSNMSLVEISNSLNFSSQSHFIQTFVKYTGMTPKKYRDQCFRSSY